MFRSKRRPVVFPQAEHARLAAAIALEWDERPAIPWEPFVAGVALHDRGYGQLDADDIDVFAEARWIEIQREGFAPRGADPVVDLIAALHVRRLVSQGGHPAALAEMDARLPELHEAAGMDEETAAAADRITELCDRLAFVFCFEEPASGALHGIRVRARRPRRDRPRPLAAGRRRAERVDSRLRGGGLPEPRGAGRRAVQDAAAYVTSLATTRLRPRRFAAYRARSAWATTLP
jgi:hypothetical protein